MSIRLFSTFLAAAILALAGCAGDAPSAQVEAAVVRLQAAPGLPAAGYFQARLGTAENAITGVASPAAERIEMHETVSENGRSRMRPIARVTGDGAAAVRFEPGGRHLMLFGLAPDLRPGSTISLTFTFHQSPPLTVPATLVAPGGDVHAGH